MPTLEYQVTSKWYIGDLIRMEAQADMKKYSIIHAPIMSFFSMDFYRDVGLNWKGIGFGYLFLLLAVFWLPPMIRIQWLYSDFVEYKAPDSVGQIPEITITDGEVSIDKPQPYYVTMPDSNEAVAIVDTTGSIVSLEDSNAFCLLTKTDFIMRSSEFETRSFNLEKIESFVLNSDRIMGWLRAGKKYVFIVLYPFLLAGEYVYRIVQVLIYAAIGLAFASSSRVKLTYSALLRMSVMAVTPCIIFASIIGLVTQRTPWMLYLMAALTYLFFAVRACSEVPDVPLPTEEIQEPEQMDFEDYDTDI